MQAVSFKGIIDKFFLFSWTSISRETVKWLLPRFVFLVIKCQWYWVQKKSFHWWKVFQSQMVCFSCYHKHLEWKSILVIGNRKQYFQFFLVRAWSVTEVKICTRILTAMKLSLSALLQLNLIQNLQHIRATKPCFSTHFCKAIYSQGCHKARKVAKDEKAGKWT